MAKKSTNSVVAKGGVRRAKSSRISVGLSRKEISDLRKAAGYGAGKKGYKYPYFVSITHAGFDVQVRFLEDFKNMLLGQGSDALLTAAIQGVGASLAENFRTSGKSSGKNWPPIRESTIARKDRLGLNKTAEPLRRGGALETAINEFVALHGARDTATSAKTYTGSVVDRTGPRGGRQSYENKISVTIQRKSGPVGIEVRKGAYMTIHGNAVKNHYGFSTTYNKKRVNVPARPFWFIEAKEREEALKNVKLVLDGQFKSSYLEPKKNYSRGGMRGSRKTGKPGWAKTIREKFEAQHARKAAGGDMSREQRIKFIEDTLIRNAIAKGLRFKYKGVDYKGSRKVMAVQAGMDELRQNPFLFVAVSGVIGQEDLRKALRHESRGTTPTYMSSQTGKIYHHYVIRQGGKEEQKLMDVTDRADLTEYIMHKNSGRFVKDGMKGKQYAQGTDLASIVKKRLSETQSMKTRKVHETEVATLSDAEIRIIGMRYFSEESARLSRLRGGVIRGKKGQTIAREERHALASSIRGFVPLDITRRVQEDTAYEKALRTALTAAVHIDETGKVVYTSVEMRESVKALNHKIGNNFGDVILMLRAQKQFLLDRERKRQGLGPEDILDEAKLMAFAGVELDLYFKSGARAGQRSRSVSYSPDEERELAYYAPMGHAIFGPKGRFKTGGRPSSRGPLAGSMSKRFSRHNLAHNIMEALPSPRDTSDPELRRQREQARGSAERMLQRFFGHDDPTIFDRHYMVYVDDEPLGVPRQKEGNKKRAWAEKPAGPREELRAYVPGLSWDERQLTRNQILWINRAIKMTTYIMERATTQAYFDSVDIYIRHELGMYSQNLTARVVNGRVELYDGKNNIIKSYSEIKKDIMAYEAERDEFRTNLARNQGIISGKERLVGPAYFTKQRQLGWMVNYQDFEKIFTGTPESISGFGITLSQRENIASPGKLFQDSVKTFQGVPWAKVSIDAEYVPYTQIGKNGEIVFGYKESDARAAGYLDPIAGDAGIEYAARAADAFRAFVMERAVYQSQVGLEQVNDTDLWRMLVSETDPNVISRKANKSKGDSYVYGPPKQDKEELDEADDRKAMWWKPLAYGYSRPKVDGKKVPRVPGGYDLEREGGRNIMMPGESPYKQYAAMRSKKEQQVWVELWIDLQQYHGDMLLSVRLTPAEFWKLPGVQKAWNYFKKNQDALLQRQKVKREEFRILIYEIMEVLNDRDAARRDKSKWEYDREYSSMDIVELVNLIRARKKIE